MVSCGCGSSSSSLVSLEVFSQHKSCWSCRLQLYATEIYLSPVFLYFFILEFRNLFLSVPSVLSCVLFYSLSCPSFYSFLPFFLLPVLFSPSLFIRFIFWTLLLFSFQICCPFFSFLFSNYSILSTSLLCSITIQSVLFLLEPSTLSDTSLLSLLLLLLFSLSSFFLIRI